MNFTFEIQKHIATLKTYPSGWVRELNLVSWNREDAKYDIRDWSPDHSKMTRGIRLTYPEYCALANALYGETEPDVNLIACSIYASGADDNEDGVYEVLRSTIAFQFHLAFEAVPMAAIAAKLEEHGGVLQATVPNTDVIKVRFRDNYCGLA